ncbi:MAG: hypothetical protein J0L72_09790 [Armatimonadetes bacterium]|nr:hypothetical protein [Armatimonadota bacterium]
MAKIVGTTAIAALALLILSGCGGSGGGKLPNYTLTFRNSTSDDVSAVDFLPSPANTVLTQVSITTNLGGIYTFGGSSSTLPDPSGSGATVITDVNASGKYVGYSLNGTAPRPVSGTGGTLAYDTTGITVVSGESTTFFGINNSGTVVGFQPSSTQPIFRRSSTNVVTSYAMPTGETVSQIAGISANGTVMGRTTSAKAFVLTPTGEIILQDAGFYSDSNASNVAVGYDSSGPFKINLPNGVRQRLPLPPGGSNGIAFGINDNGDIVGKYTLSGTDRPCIWYEDTGAFVDLSSKLTVPSGYTLLAATEINNNGDVLLSFRNTGTNVRTIGILNPIP